MQTRLMVKCGFSLVEMLVVISIASILSLLVSLGLGAALGTAFDGEVSDLSSTLARARAFAMANNTYVFVGIQEFNSATAPNAAQSAGTGRLAVVVLASPNGTRGYQTSISSSTALSTLNIVSPLREYENLHLLTSAASVISSTLPNNTTSPGQTCEVASTTSLLTFNWPPGSTSSQYPAFGSNGTVIQFSPQGEAQIVTGAYTDSQYPWIELDVAPTHGTITSAKNPATILIDGASGSVTTYRE